MVLPPGCPGDGEQSAGSRRIEAFDLHTLNLFEIALKLRGDAGNLLPFPVGPVDEAEISAGKRFLEPAGRNGTAAVLRRELLPGPIREVNDVAEGLRALRSGGDVEKVERLPAAGKRQFHVPGQQRDRAGGGRADPERHGAELPRPAGDIFCRRQRCREEGPLRKQGGVELFLQRQRFAFRRNGFRNFARRPVVAGGEAVFHFTGHRRFGRRLHPDPLRRLPAGIAERHFGRALTELEFELFFLRRIAEGVRCRLPAVDQNFRFFLRRIAEGVRCRLPAVDQNFRRFREADEFRPEWFRRDEGDLRGVLLLLIDRLFQPGRFPVAQPYRGVTADQECRRGVGEQIVTAAGGGAPEGAAPLQRADRGELRQLFGGRVLDVGEKEVAGEGERTVDAEPVSFAQVARILPLRVALFHPAGEGGQRFRAGRAVEIEQRGGVVHPDDHAGGKHRIIPAGVGDNAELAVADFGNLTLPIPAVAVGHLQLPLEQRGDERNRLSGGDHCGEIGETALRASCPAPCRWCG